MKGLLESGTIVDVRTEEEFLEEHFPNAINIPLSEVPGRIDEFRIMKKPIIAYCKSGNRSTILISLLYQIGIIQTINGGGLEDLKKNKDKISIVGSDRNN